MATERRRILAALGGAITASTAGLAGCLESVTDGGGGDDGPAETDERAETDETDESDEADDDGDESEIDGVAVSTEYRDWLPVADEPIAFAFMDWEKAMEVDGDSDDEDEESDDENDDDEPNEDDDAPDPMVGLSMVGTGRIVPAAVGADLGEADLIPLVDSDAADAEDFDSAVTGLLAVNDCSVILGDIEPEEIGDRLTTEPDDWYPVQFEHVETIDEYDVYHGVDREHRVAAVGDDAIVYRRGEGAEAAVDRLLDARLEGGVTDADTDTDASWLLETGGGGHLAFGGYGAPPAMEVQKIGVESVSYDVAAEHDALSDVEGVVSALELDTVDDEMTGSFAAVFEDEGDVDPDLEERLGSSATERTVDIDGRRVSATARWTNEGEDSPVPRL